jgi:four helix bundle protein
MHNFKELKIWQKSRILVKDIYKISYKFPTNEQFGLTSQIQRAVISIPTNIAEGSGRSTDKDFARFLDIAISSGFETETEIILAHDLEYITEVDFNESIAKIQEVQKMIFAFRQSLIK